MDRFRSTRVKGLFIILLVAIIGAIVGVSLVVARDSSKETYSQDLVAVQGAGSGAVNVTSMEGAGGLTAQIDVNLDGAPPNTTFFVQRAPELGRDLGSDGICQRAQQIDTWVTPPSPCLSDGSAACSGPARHAADITRGERHSSHRLCRTWDCGRHPL